MFETQHFERYDALDTEADAGVGDLDPARSGRGPFARDHEVSTGVIPVKTSPIFTAGTPRLLLDANASDFDLARDGRVLIVEALDPASAPGRLNVVVNWFEEIGRK